MRPYIVAVNTSKHVRKELKADVRLQNFTLLVGLMTAEQGMRSQRNGCIWKALLHLSSFFSQIRMAHSINFLLQRENPRKEFCSNPVSSQNSIRILFLKWILKIILNKTAILQSQFFLVESVSVSFIT